MAHFPVLIFCFLVPAIYAECPSAAIELTPDSRSATFTSPGYPNQIDPKMMCHTVVTAPANSTLEVICDVDLGWCTEAYLKVQTVNLFRFLCQKRQLEETVESDEIMFLFYALNKEPLTTKKGVQCVVTLQ